MPPDLLNLTEAVLSGLYFVAAGGIALFGMLGLITLGLYYRHRQERFPCPQVDAGHLPPVTVQLPIYNERYVVERLVRAAVSLDYPGDRLQIQVLDDSTDDTTAIAAQLVAHYRALGVDIHLLHRTQRQGYKAGALQAGLASVSGEFIAVFDADFEPRPDFLRQTVPHFLANARLGMVQARWGHLNPTDSPLTAAQTIALDKHFAMEQTVRHRANLFPKFNGSAGIWRRDCLIDAGGWQADTVCEDLCLSTRAILAGWHFRFLNDVVAPAELPATISAYKNQQSRWAKGSTQCLLKFGPAIAASKSQSPVARIYALFSMAGYATHLLLLILLLVQVPLIYLDYRPPLGMFAFALLGIGQPILFVLGQQTLYRDWLRRLRYLPALLLVAIGLAPANSRAIIEAIFGRSHVFIRTPKGVVSGLKKSAAGQAGYSLAGDWIVLAELGLACYAVLGLGLSIWRGNPGPIFFMATCALGFGYVALASLNR